MDISLLPRYMPAIILLICIIIMYAPECFYDLLTCVLFTVAKPVVLKNVTQFIICIIADTTYLIILDFEDYQNS